MYSLFIEVKNRKNLMHLLVFCILISQTMQTVYLPNDILGPNLLINGDFQVPVVGSAILGNYNTIPGWNCTPSCNILSPYYLDKYLGDTFFTNIYPMGQVLNMNANNYYTKVTQNMHLTEGIYLFAWNFVFPINNASTKKLVAYLVNATNSMTALGYQIGPFDYMPIQTYGTFMIFQVLEGPYTLNMIMLGTMDWNGYFLDGVTIQKFNLDNLMAASLNNTFNNAALNTLNTLPGVRIVANSVVNFLTNFDRLQFYFYHKMNTSYYSNMLLNSIVEFQNQKGSFLFNYLNQIETVNFTNINYLIENFDFKINYTNKRILSLNNNGNGFLANNYTYFFYQLPVIIAIQVLFWVLFKITFKYQISLLFRKYCFMGTTFFLFFEGNVQNFSYYFFFQIQNLFSATLYHKLLNLAILGFIFMLMFYCFGALFWFNHHYGKCLKYFFQYHKKHKIRFLCNQILQKSAYPATFGCVHILLYEKPGTQLLVLAGIQISLICMRIYFVYKRGAYVTFRVWVNNFGSILRLIFQLNFYSYYMLPDLKVPLNQFSRILLLGYLINWALQMVLELLYNGVRMGKIIHKKCKKPVKMIKVEAIKENIVLKKKEELDNDQKFRKVSNKMSKLKVFPLKNSKNARQLRIKYAYPKSKEERL